MPDPSQGFASGMITGQQAAQSQQMSSLLQEEAGVKIQSEQVALESSKLMLERQKMFAKLLQGMNTGGQAGPGNQPVEQSRALATNLFGMARAAMTAGLTEEATNLTDSAEKLQKGALEIEEKTFDMQIKGAALTSSLIKDLKPGDTAEFHRRLMLYQGQSGIPLNKDLLNQPFTQELKDRLLAAAETLQEKATRGLTDAHKREADSATALNALRQELVKSQKKLVDQRTENAKKVGVTATKKEQAQVDALKDVSNDLDDLSAQLAEHPDMTLTGVKGRIHAVGESVSGFFGGGGEETPEHDFQTALGLMRAKLPAALRSTRMSDKDTRAILAEVADLQKPGVSTKIAINKLDTIKRYIQAQIDRAGVKPSETKSADGDDADKGLQGDVEVSNW